MDKITTMFFEPERWAAAINKGVLKDIKKNELIKLTKTETRIAIAKMMQEGNYVIVPPHTAKIPKENPGEFRTVYVNEPIDRVVLSIANDLFFELMPQMIHPRCKSYQKGLSCGKVVKEASAILADTHGEDFGFKADLSKYFDSVSLEWIDWVFDEIERVHGKSALVSVIRNYYHCNLFFDEEGNLQESYQSLKQGCAVAAFLADAVLYALDTKMTEMADFYVRYSDDILFIGANHQQALAILEDTLGNYGLKLNPKKVELLSSKRWFKFLGYAIKGPMISLSSSRIKHFQEEIQARTTKRILTTTPSKALREVNRFLYIGDGTHSWATQVLGVCNVVGDINRMNAFVMDALRAVETKRGHIGGLGYIVNKADGCIARGTGANVRSNRERTSDRIEGYLSLNCMRKAMLAGKSVYESLVLSLQ